MDPTEIIRFWFEESRPEQRFRKDPEFDREITRRFSNTLRQASQGELHSWRSTAEGALAEIIVLDQFSRNIYRDQPEAFGCDDLALIRAEELIDRGQDRELTTEQKAFAYMPFMHSESIEVHDRALELFSQPGLENNYHFELRHKEIIDRFGRYPHRNAILGRESTPEEIEFLKQPGSGF